MAVLASDVWYELSDHNPLEFHQGDIVRDLEVPDPDLLFLPESVGDSILTFEFAVVISQDCDLIADQGNTYALLCPAFTLDFLAQKGVRVRNLWTEARKGQHTHYFPLRECTLMGWECQPRLVDFRQVYQMSLSNIDKLYRVQDKHVRIRSPYRFELVRRFAQKLTRIPFGDDLTTEWNDIEVLRQTHPSPPKGS